MVKPWNTRYSHPVSHCCDIWRHWPENPSQLLPFCLTTTSIITEITPLNILIGSCTDLHVDSGSVSCSVSCSGSNLKYWLRLLLLFQPKMQTPAGVHYGTPAPWSSLVCGWIGLRTLPQSGLQDRILLNCTRIENAHEVRKKTFVFLLWM